MIHTVLWQGKPSSWLLLGTFTLAVLLSSGLFFGLSFLPMDPILRAGSALGLFSLMIIPAWLQIQFIHYKLTSDTLYIQRGLLVRKTDPIDLFRVLDAVAEEPLFLRPFHVGSVMVYSADVTAPVQKLIGVRLPLHVKDMIRNQAASERKRHGVREISTQRAP